jgi:hypothetical protein
MTIVFTSDIFYLVNDEIGKGKLADLLLLAYAF